MANKLILSGEFANRDELEEHAYFGVRALHVWSTLVDINSLHDPTSSHLANSLIYSKIILFNFIE